MRLKTLKYERQAVSARQIFLPAALPLAILLLGLALQVRDGLYNPLAIALLTGSALACGFAIFAGGISELRDHTRLELFLKLAALVQFVTIVLTRGTLPSVRLAVIIAAIAMLLLNKLGRASAAIVLLMFAGIGLTTLHNSPNPHIDVFVQN